MISMFDKDGKDGQPATGALGRNGSSSQPGGDGTKLDGDDPNADPNAPGNNSKISADPNANN